MAKLRALDFPILELIFVPMVNSDLKGMVALELLELHSTAVRLHGMHAGEAWLGLSLKFGSSWKWV
mgnify:CR=1 FL=1